MKKRKIVYSLVSLLSIALLVSCSGDDSSTSSTPDSSYNSSTTDDSSSTSSSSEYPDTVDSITINNKDELQERWLTTDSSRRLSLTTDPVLNISGLINDGKITITSSDTDVIVIEGLYLYPQESGTSTITVTYGDAYDSVEISVYDEVSMIPSNDVISLADEATSSITFSVTSTSGKNDNTDYDWSSSDASIATVNENGVVTGVAAGTVTIRATDKEFDGNYAEYEITVIAEEEDITPISEVSSTLLSSEAITIEGEIVALTTRGFLVTDGTGTVYYYLNNDPSTDYAIGDHVKVRNGTAGSGYSTYNGLIQFTNTATVTPLSSQWGGTVADAVDLDVETAESFVGTSFDTTDVVKYRWRTVTSTLDGYTTTNLDGADVVLEPSYMPSTFTLDTYAYYEVEAYFGGYSSSHGYAAMYITSVTPLDVTENLIQASSYDVSVYGDGGTTSITIVGLTPDGSSDTLSVTSGDESIATVTSSGDYEYTITGGSTYGSTTLTATLGTLTKTIDVTVIEPLYESEIGDLVDYPDDPDTKDVLFSGVVAASNNYNALIVDDGTGAVYVRDSSNATNYEVGSYHQFQGGLTNYYGTPELNGIDSSTELSSEEAPATQEVTPLTAEIAQSFTEVSTSNPLKTTDVKPYSFTATCTSMGTYDASFTYEGVEIRLVSVTNTDFKIEQGKTYDIVAYFYGYYSSYSYIQAMAVSVEENTEAGGEVDTTMPDPISTTVSDLIENGEEDTLYTVSGIMEGWQGDEYGNGYLTDPETGDSIQIYGSTGSDSSLSAVNGVVSFDNPRDAQTTLADMTSGMEVTMNVVYQLYGSTHEIMGVVTSYGASENTYGVDIAASENGTATPDKEAYSYGETVTLTITPNEGYEVSSVIVNHSYTTETLSPDEDGDYTFSATVVNNVTVNYRDVNEEVTSTTLTSTNLGLGNYSDGTATVDGIELAYTELGDYGHGIQWRISGSNVSAIWNTSATPSAIKSITFNYNSYQSSTNPSLAVQFSTGVITEDGSSNDVTYTAGTTSITVDCDIDDATFFRINHGSTSGAIYLDSIVINY